MPVERAAPKLIVLKNEPDGRPGGKAAPDPEMTKRVHSILNEGIPLSDRRPVRPLIARPSGFFVPYQGHGDEIELSPDAAREALGRLVGVADEGGWPLYVWRYNFERGEPVAHVGFVIADVERKRPDAIIRLPHGYDMLHYEKLGDSFGSIMRGRGRGV